MKRELPKVLITFEVKREDGELILNQNIFRSRYFKIKLYFFDTLFNCHLPQSGMTDIKNILWIGENAEYVAFYIFAFGVLNKYMSVQ